MGRKRLNQALSAFKINPQVYHAALAMLGDDFVRSSNVCSNAACVFSYKRPGQPCRTRMCGEQRQRVSDLCFWCNPFDVADAESKPFGIRRIAQDLRKFSVSLDVFKAAIGKLSADFLADLRICSLEVENTAMLKEDRVEQCNQDRFYVEYMTAKRPGLIWDYVFGRLTSKPFTHGLSRDLIAEGEGYLDRWRGIYSFTDWRQWFDDYSAEFVTEQSEKKRMWMKVYDFTTGEFRYGFPSWNGRPFYDELARKYHQEKPGQARCRS